MFAGILARYFIDGNEKEQFFSSVANVTNHRKNVSKVLNLEQVPAYFREDLTNKEDIFYP